MSDIFISYASADRPRIKPLLEVLAQQGWSIWWDRTIPPGKTWPQVIEAALKDAKCVLVLWSRDSIKSDWVHIEATHAHRRRILVPALLDDVEIPLAFSLVQSANLVNWTGLLPNAEIDELIRAVSGILPESAVRLNPKDGLKYVWIPPGEFTMGCSPGDNGCRDNEKPARVVQIQNGFWLSQTQVTQAAWKKVMGDNPSHFKGDQLPVESVDWNQAADYCRKSGGRLPTEQEWEYAARGGTTHARYGDLDAIAWHGENSGETTHPVGLKQMNAFGLYDMLGNVSEWTDTNYDASGETKVLRGGSWYFDPEFVRVSFRSSVAPSYRNFNFGFRCAGEFRG